LKELFRVLYLKNIRPQVFKGYLPHIDGLRSIAVLSVILFHLDINLFEGGFVGVDMFFVISGFLISSHLFEQLESGKFSLRGFYLRRIRRLFPALVTTILITYLIAFFIFPAANLERFSLSVLSSTFSYANIGFWVESGYFDSDALLKPLLHTWSLSVEEQFYLIWPTLIVIFWRLRNPFLLILIIGIVSLLFSEWYVQKDASVAFFLTPFRIYEFCIGAILVFKFSNTELNEALKVAFALFGYVLISISIFTFSEATPFPGFFALIPCIGTALIIRFGNAPRLAFLLSNLLVVGVGRVSYSLYLVHWPLIVFYLYYRPVGIDRIEKLALLAITFVLAIILYTFIEKPFRKMEKKVFQINSRNLVFFCTTVVVMLVSLSVLVQKNNGFSGRFNYPQISKEQTKKGMDDRTKYLGKICGERGWDQCDKPIGGGKDILVIGDSHALDGLNIMAQAYPDYDYTLKELGGCPPLVDNDYILLHSKHPNREKCLVLNKTRFEDISSKEYKVIVISVLFGWYKPEHLMHAIDRIRNSSTAEIVVFGNYLELKKDFSLIVSLGRNIKQNKGLVTSFGLYDKELDESAIGKYIFVSKKQLFCNNGELKNCALWFDGVPFAYDAHHLSFEATTFAAARLKESMQLMFLKAGAENQRSLLVITPEG